MKSDYSAARQHLERAFYYLCGEDEFSQQARRMITGLMDGTLLARMDGVSEIKSTRLSVDDQKVTTRGLH